MSQSLQREEREEREELVKINISLQYDHHQPSSAALQFSWSKLAYNLYSWRVEKDWRVAIRAFITTGVVWSAQ